MANLRALSLHSTGAQLEVQDTDLLYLGNIAPAAGNLTVGGAAGSNVVVSAGQTLSVSGATGGLNLTGGADLLAAAGSTLQGFDSIEGITSTNLLDKSASETVTGQWTFQSSNIINPKLIVKAAGGEAANSLLFQVQDSVGANLFSVDVEGDVVIAGGETVAGATIYTGNVTLGDGGNTVQLGSAAGPAVGDNVYINTTGTADGNFSVTTANFNITTAGNIDTNGNVLVINADSAGVTAEYSGTVWLDGDGVANVEGWRLRDDGSTSSFEMQYKQNPILASDLTEVWTSILTATPTGVTINGSLTATSIIGPTTGTGTTSNVWGVNTDAAGGTAENSLLASAGGDGVNVQSWRWFNSTTPKTFTLQYKQNPTDITDPSEVGWAPNVIVAYSTGVVDFPGNVNAQAGLDVTGAALTVDANGIDTLGSIDLNGTLSFDSTGTIDTSGNNGLTISVGTNTLGVTAGLVDLRTNVTVLDIPAGTATKINNISLVAQFTAANVNTLLNGSNADSLHTHTAVDAGQVVVSGLTTAGMATYQAGYISANNTILPTDCSSATGTFATSSFAGVYDGVAGTMVTNGKVEVQFDAGIVGMVAGDPAILSWTNAGQFVNSSSGSPGGSFITRVGTVLDTSTYGVNQRCTIVIHAGAPTKK